MATIYHYRYGTEYNTVTIATTDQTAINMQTLADSIKTDDSPFTPSVDKQQMVGFIYDDTAPDSVNEGDAGVARMSANRCIYTNIRSADGNERGANINALNQLLSATNIYQVNGAALAVTNPVWVELTDGAAAISGTNPLNVEIGDGTNQVTILGTLAANQPTTNNGFVTASMNYGYDTVNAQFERVSVDSSGNQYILFAEDRPGEDSPNDWRDTNKISVGEYTPNGTLGTAVAAAATDVLASTEVIGYPNFTLYIKNAGGGGGGAFTDVNVLVSANNSDWTSLDWASANVLAANGNAVYQVNGNSYRYVKVQATAAAGPNDTTADCYITANLG